VRRLLAGTTAAVLAALLLHCGKKGPPLPPLEGSIPRVVDLAAAQVGRTVRATFSLPIRPDAREVDYAALGVELWRRPAGAAPRLPPPPRLPSLPGGRPTAPPPPPPSVDELTKDATLAVSLSGEDLFDFLAQPFPVLVDRLPDDLTGGAFEYALVLKTDVRKRGTVSNIVDVDVAPPPAPPEDVEVTLAPGSLVVSWTPAPPAEGAPAPTYAVYRAQGEEPFGARPLDEKPVKAPPFEDRDVTAGVTYRHVVRAVALADGVAIESDASAEVRTTYRDVFPPRVPESLRLIAEGPRAVSLIWNPNDEPDLGGYAIHRREVGAAAWTRLDAGGARTATFVDRTPLPGRTHEYAVSAYDTATPPNESERCAPQSVDLPAAAGP
jgi:hypothetical protein